VVFWQDRYLFLLTRRPIDYAVGMKSLLGILCLFLGAIASAQTPPADLTLVLENIRGLDNGHHGHVYVTLRRGETGPVFSAAADYNESSVNTVTVQKWEQDAATLRAEVEIRIGPDGARRGRPNFPTPADVFALTIRAELSADDWAPIRPDREAFMPSWRKDTPLVAGKLLRGRYEGQIRADGKGGEAQQIEGALSGAWRPAAHNGWSALGPAWVEHDGSTTLLKAFLPEQCRVEGIEAWAEKSENLPLVGAGNVVVRVSSPDAKALSVLVRTEHGDFLHSQTLPLTPEPREHRIPLSSFGDRWRPFHGERLLALRVGLVDGSGVGLRTVVIHDLRVLPGEAAAAPNGITVVVRPETAFLFNGAGEIPPGLFGFHDVNESNPRAPNEGEADPVDEMRQLRPGLLRPLTHTAFGLDKVPDDHLTPWPPRDNVPWMVLDGVFAQRVDAADARGRVVWTHTSDLWARPPWMDAPMDAFLPKIETFYAQLAREAWSPEHPERLLRDLEVWNEPFMWGRHINMGFRVPKGVVDVADETQYGYIPGKRGSDAWSEIFRAARRGAKAVNPHVRLGGPSAPDISQHDYQDFRNHTLRILEAVGGELDFFTEHHYGGNPFVTAAGYDVVRSAFQMLHGRVVPILNTESNDLGASDAGKAAWNLAEILNLIRTQPDLAQGRALHACWNGYLNNTGEIHAWQLMAPLRGRLVDLDVDQPRLSAVAAHPRVGELVIVGVDHGVGESDVRFPMPPGFRVEELTLLLAEMPLSEVQLRDVDGAGLPEIPAGKTRLVTLRPEVREGFLRFPLPARSAFRVRMAKEGYEPSRVRRQQYTPFPRIFVTLSEGETLSLALERKIEPDRLYLRSVYTGSLRLAFDGHPPIELPEGPSRSGHAELSNIEIAPELLLQNPRLIAGPGGAEVLSVGWVLEE
jgi:hypothetical protein